MHNYNCTVSTWSPRKCKLTYRSIIIRRIHNTILNSIFWESYKVLAIDWNVPKMFFWKENAIHINIPEKLNKHWFFNKNIPKDIDFNKKLKRNREQDQHQDQGWKSRLIQIKSKTLFWFSRPRPGLALRLGLVTSLGIGQIFRKFLTIVPPSDIRIINGRIRDLVFNKLTFESPFNPLTTLFIGPSPRRYYASIETEPTDKWRIVCSVRRKWCE